MRLSRAVLTAVLSGWAVLLTLPGVAAAAGPPVGFSGIWSPDATTVRVPSPTFPVGTLTTTAGSPQVQGGASTFLNASTPFGAEFRSSRNQPYVSLRTPGTSSATVAFASATPASGWGFALGDVDAETVVVTATGVGGVPLTTAELGLQGAFSGCVPSPRPGACPGPVPGDVPAVDQTAPDRVTVTGQVPDSTGASAWFRPTVPVLSLTLASVRTSNPLTVPVFQLWIAALVPSATLSGTVTSTDPATPPAGVTVALERPDGTPVVDPATTEQATATTASDGSFTFPVVAPEPVVVVVGPPAGVSAPAAEVAVDLSAGDVTGLAVALPVPAPAPPTTTPTPPTPTPTAAPAPPVVPVPVAPGPPVGRQLAATGAPVVLLAGVGGLLLVAGGGAVVAGRGRVLVRQPRAGR